MDIDFKLIANEEEFELLCRDVFEANGARIVSGPSRGPDSKKDLLVDIDVSSLVSGPKAKRYLVQCKHKAVSGKSVYENELGDTRSACVRNSANGYLLITSSVASKSVGENFDAHNKEGLYTHETWDYKKLEQKILETPNCAQLLERYGLLESAESILDYIRSLTESVPNFPFTDPSTVIDRGFRGLIFDKFNDEAGAADKIGFVAVPDKSTTKKLEEFKSKHKCETCYFISPKEQNGTITLTDFAKIVYQFRDAWYQDGLYRFSLSCPRNPTLIRLIETFVTNNPIIVGDSLKKIVTTVLEDRSSENSWMLIIEASKAAAKHSWKEYRRLIWSWILFARDSENKSTDKDGRFPLPLCAVIQYLASSLGELDKASNDLSVSVLSEVKKATSLDYKAALIQYFIKTTDESALATLKEIERENGATEVHPCFHGIHYNSKKIDFAFNSAPATLTQIISYYEKALN
jgi:hypothetical protein